MEDARIALVGDYDPESIPHRAIPRAIQLVQARPCRIDWLHSAQLRDPAVALAGYHGVWCIPGSPYANTRGVLDAIRLARANGLPFLGTCAGFQHALLEYAAAEWGLSSDGPELIIAPLSCLLDQESGDIHLEPGSRLASIYALEVATEIYHCSYGLNAEHSWRLTKSDLTVAARSDRGEVRAIELRSHPFYIATLYQPERSALQGAGHPLIRAFVRACEAVSLGGRS